MANDLNRAALDGVDQQARTSSSPARRAARAAGGLRLQQPPADRGARRVLLSLHLRGPRAGPRPRRAGEVVVIEDETNNEIRALVYLTNFFDAFLYVSRDVDGTVLRLLDETEADRPALRAARARPGRPAVRLRADLSRLRRAGDRGGDLRGALVRRAARQARSAGSPGRPSGSARAISTCGSRRSAGRTRSRCSAAPSTAWPDRSRPARRPDRGQCRDRAPAPLLRGGALGRHRGGDRARRRGPDRPGQRGGGGPARAPGRGDDRPPPHRHRAGVRASSSRRRSARRATSPAAPCASACAARPASSSPASRPRTRRRAARGMCSPSTTSRRWPPRSAWPPGATSPGASRTRSRTR